ncbi:hypothetical protein Dimus_020879 [Dionaea muscipula]
MSVTLKREVARSRVNGVNIKFDGMTLSSILDIPGHSGICDYVKEIFEESKYCHPLEITRKFAHDDSIAKARTVKSIKMKPFTHLLHIFVMKNFLPMFGKRDIASFMDLTYMDYLLTRKKMNLPRVIIRHMGYVINIPHHELSYGELLTRIFHAFDVPLNDKEPEYPVETDKFEETFLSMCSLRRENREQVEDVEVEGEQPEQEAEITKAAGSESIKEFFDAKDEGKATEDDAPTTQPDVKQKQKGKSTAGGVDPSDTISDYDLLHLQAEFDRALKENERFEELLQQIKLNPQPPYSP